MARHRFRVLLALALVSSLSLFVFGWRAIARPAASSSAPAWSSARALYYQSLVDESSIPETKYVKGVAGFNYFKNLYVFNDTFCFVTSKPDKIGLPEVGAHFVTTGNHNVPDNTLGRLTPPEEDRWRVLSPREAHQLFGPVALRNPGITMWFNDEDGVLGEQKFISFLAHYYHYVGEMFLGGWRLVVSASGRLELPSRIIFRATSDSWRDRVRIIPWLQHTLLAGTIIEERDAVYDRMQSGQANLYQEIAIIDRFTAHVNGQNVKWWNKAHADTLELKVPVTWMSPLRDRIVAMSEASACRTTRAKSRVPVVTYINRQLTGRRLVDEDHLKLVAAMEDLEKQGLIEFVDAVMENIPRIEQFCIAARTDIMIGVHGNGLSHQLWMKSGGGVLEFMFEGGFTRDYGILAEFMAHEYYAIHNDKVFPVEEWRKPSGYAVDQGPNFHSSKIRVEAAFIAGLVKDMAKRRRRGPTPLHWKA